MATQGTATIDFGAFPGASDATVNITGQGAITGSSLVEAWIMPADTADHSADEHVFETIAVRASAPSAGVGFTIYGWNTNQINEPLETAGASKFRSTSTTVYGNSAASVGGNGTRLYGQWNVAWVWN
jgi:hypothetical protein